MYHDLSLSNQQQLKIAALTGSVGFATALAMTTFDPGLQYFLPEAGFHLAATLGAGYAGFIAADGFGRPGAAGLCWAMATALFTTLAEAALGAMLLAPPFMAPLAAPLGWVALAEAAGEGDQIVKLWLGSMTLLHLCAIQARLADGRRS